MAKIKIMVLTSGGDAPGMNACLYYLTKILEANGAECVGVVGGYEGLIEGNFISLTSEVLKPYLSNGGSYIKAGRSDAFRTKEGMEKAVKNFKASKCKCIIAIGGNGTLQGMNEIMQKIPMIGIPSTIDNDLFYTDYSIGFDSSANENLRLIKNIKAACRAQGKIAIIEIMGRDCSKLAFASAINSAADICIVKENPIKESEIFKKINNLLKLGKDDIVIVAVENFMDLNLLKDNIIKKFKIDTRVFINGYAQRGCDASSFDISLALKYAAKACDLVLNNNFNKIIGIKNDVAFADDISDNLSNASTFDKDAYVMLYK